MAEGPPPAAYRPGRSPFRARPQDPLHERVVPVSARIPDYRPNTARRDLIAGLTVAALALPSGMAYAEVAGLPPVNGLYALLLPTVLYTFLGSSRQLIVGPEGSISALVGAALLPLAAAGSSEASELAATLALLVAACFLLAWVARLGWLADYFSRPVLVGYIHGVAIVLVCGQLGKLLGVDIDATKPIGQIVDAVRELDEASGTTVLVGAVALGALLAARSFMPRLPAALVVVLASILVSWAVDLEADGVAVVGAIPSGLPSFNIPRPPLGDAADLVPAAIGIFLVSFADGILTARSFAGKRNQHIRANQELLAFSGMSAAAGVTQGFPLGASGSRTAVNDQMGARTQIAGLVAAGAIALVLLFFTEPMSYLPKAVLGAVIVSAAIGLVDRGAWRALRLVSRFELGIAVATLVGVVVLGVLQALVIAVALSISTSCGGARSRGTRCSAGSTGWVAGGTWSSTPPRASPRESSSTGSTTASSSRTLATSRVAYSRRFGAPPTSRTGSSSTRRPSRTSMRPGSRRVRELAAGRRRDGIGLVVARMKPAVYEQVAVAGVAEAIGEERFFPTVRAAVAACLELDAAHDGSPA